MHDWHQKVLRPAVGTVVRTTSGQSWKKVDGGSILQHPFPVCIYRRLCALYSVKSMELYRLREVIRREAIRLYCKVESRTGLDTYLDYVLRVYGVRLNYYRGWIPVLLKYLNLMLHLNASMTSPGLTGFSWLLWPRRASGQPRVSYFSFSLCLSVSLVLCLSECVSVYYGVFPISQPKLVHCHSWITALSTSSSETSRDCSVYHHVTTPRTFAPISRAAAHCMICTA